MSENRFQRMADTYDHLAPVMVPQYDLMQRLMLDYLQIEKAQSPVIVDLGGGSGRFLERVLNCNPSARCYYVDASESFLRLAQKKLKSYEGAVRYVLADLEDGWVDQVPSGADYIFSMSTIHHLENHEKQRLYERCFDLLNPGGWLVNIDEMKTIYPDAYFNSLHYWSRYCELQASRLQGDDSEIYQGWQREFEKWKDRNIRSFGQRKTRGDDIHASYLVQMAWLREIGFRQVDLFAKIHLWCIIGGKKPG